MSRAATTRASTPRSIVGCRIGAKNGEWLVGMSSLTVPRAAASAHCCGSSPPQNQNTSGTPDSRANHETSSLPVNMPGSMTVPAPNALSNAAVRRAVASWSLIVGGSVWSIEMTGSSSAPDAAASARTIRSTRAGGHVGYVGVSHDVTLDGQRLFHSGVHLHGGPAPVRRFLPELIQLIWDREIDPGVVFDLTLPLEEAAEGYKAMDERRAIKVLLTV